LDRSSDAGWNNSSGKTRRAEMQAKIDALESMSESLAAQRPGTGIDLGQGPKTRGALRDLLQ
jgi:hypothetical protein